jgi:hypothetical protein
MKRKTAIRALRKDVSLTRGYGQIGIPRRGCRALSGQREDLGRFLRTAMPRPLSCCSSVISTRMSRAAQARVNGPPAATLLVTVARRTAMTAI